MSNNHHVYLIKKSFFTASHYHDGALDEVEHSHEFHYEVKLKGVTNEEGFLMDFRDLEKTLNDKVNHELNYKTLNKLFRYPTTENIAAHIYNKAKEAYPDMIHSVTVYETPESYIIYEGKDE